SYFVFTSTAPTQLYTLSLHDALPILAEVALHESQWFSAHILQRPADLAELVAERRRARAVNRLAVHLQPAARGAKNILARRRNRSEEHTSELQSQSNLVCRLLLEKKK